MFLVFAPQYSTRPEPSNTTLHLKSESPSSTSDVSTSYNHSPGSPSSNNVYQFVEHSKRKDRAVRSQVSKHVMRDYVHRRAEFRHSVNCQKLQWIVKKKDVQKEMPTQRRWSNKSSEAKQSPNGHQTGPGTHAIRYVFSDKHEELPFRGTGMAPSPCNPCDPRKARKKFRGHMSAKQVHTAVRECFETPASPPGNATDPFQTLPDRTTKMEQIILQHCKKHDPLPNRYMGQVSEGS